MRVSASARLRERGWGGGTEAQATCGRNVLVQQPKTRARNA